MRNSVNDGNDCQFTMITPLGANIRSLWQIFAGIQAFLLGRIFQTGIAHFCERPDVRSSGAVPDRELAEGGYCVFHEKRLFSFNGVHYNKYSIRLLHEF